MPDFDLVVRNGRLVTAEGITQANIGISGGLIAAIGQNLSSNEVIDAAGKLILPGAVDPHVHLEMPAGITTSSDDWESGTVAAACGGTTTVIDFIEPEGEQSLLQAFEARQKQATGKAVIDFGLHMTLTKGDRKTLEQIPGVINAGMPSFKVYTTYTGFKLEDGALLDAMQAVKAANGSMLVHAENDAIIEHKKQGYLNAGQTAPRYHALSRPDTAEAEAIQRVLALGELSGVHLYIVHVSTARGVDAIRTARQRGQAVTGETCPQYLLLNDADYDRPGFEGAKFVCSPPLRKTKDQLALWQAISEGELQTIGTDHCPFMYHGQKDLGGEDFTKIPGGLPGIETRLSLLYTYGVKAGRISLSQWVNLCCTAPAKTFGLYPHKGALVPGADADLVIFDPDKKVTVANALLHEHVDYSPYEGLELTGYPVITIARGKVLVRDGNFTGPRKQGRFLAGNPVIY